MPNVLRFAASWLGVALALPAGVGCSLLTSLDGLSGGPATEPTGLKDPTGDAGPAADAAPGTDGAPSSRFTLTVQTTVGPGATGKVVSAPAGVDCGASCSATFDGGTLVVLTAVGGPGSYVVWSGDCSGAQATCSVAMSAARTVVATFAKSNVMFATSQVFNGDLGGLAGADAKCQAAASSANLAGNYRAWLSTASTSAASRLGSAQGWVRPDGLPFADSLTALKAGAIAYPPRLDERGTDLVNSAVTLVATGTLADGTPDPTNQSDWTTTAASFSAGTLTRSSFGWTAASGASGNSTARLYCFGTDLDAPLVTTKASGRKAFLSTSPFHANAGIAGADAICSSDAMSAGIAGSFKALLATSTASASSRFDLSKAPWVRLDGVKLVATSGDLATGTWMSSLNLLSIGAYVAYAARTGSSSPGVAGTLQTTCNDWSNAASGDGQSGRSEATNGEMWASSPTACTTTSSIHAVYCLEE